MPRPTRIRTKRVYDPPAPSDGRRILVDRLWPRGLSKAEARVDFWAKAVAPSTELRRWYHQAPRPWDEFRRRYLAELDANPEGVAELLEHFGDGPVTLLYGLRDTERNHAVLLAEYLRTRRPRAK